MSETEKKHHTEPSPPKPAETPPADEVQRRAEELTNELDELRTTLEQTREALDASERRREIERQLTAQGAIDLETATLLTETSIAQMSDADVASAVAELRRRKPFLFRAPAAQRASTMSGEAPSPPPLEDAAVDARRSGDRRALMRYLRLRRGA